MVAFESSSNDCRVSIDVLVPTSAFQNHLEVCIHNGHQIYRLRKCKVANGFQQSAGRLFEE
jgi:hypothetical protein